MRGAFSTVEMTLVLNVVGCVSPTESTADGSLLQCEGLNNQSYSCKSGHCCGEAKCCSHYYELWWFWLVWAIIFILCCCCIFHHRRTKHRLQQQQRQHEINLIAYREAHNYTAVPFYFRFLPNYLLPDYEEVVSRPLTPPPPYSALHTVSSTLPSGPLSRPQQAGHSPAVQSVPAAPDLDPLRPRAALEGADPASGVGFFLPDLDAKSLQAAQHSGSTITRSGGALDQGLAGEGRSGSEKWERGGAGDPDKGSALTDLGSCAKEKPLLPVGGRRRRRFTGDSGIEVGVCRRRGSGGAELGEGRELKELESLLGCTEDDEEEDEEEGKGGGCREFCESCSPCAHLSEDEEQNLEGPGRGGDRDRDPESVPALQISSSSSNNSCDAPAMCALMHTVNELEGTQHGNVPEGWSP